MPKVSRTLVCKKQTHIVEHAVCADMTTPSLEAWRAMEQGAWEEDPDLEDVPDDAQIKHSQKFRAGIEFFADYGYPNNSFCTVNALKDGIWEFRLGSKRISFYDTDGRGGWAPKHKVLSINDSAYPDSDFWWIPDMDESIRLGHCFGKTGQKTDPQDIEETLRVREEDTAHDRI